MPVTRSLPIVALGLAALMLGGCSSSRERSTDLSPPPARETLRDVPRWFNMPPHDEDFLFASATATSRDLQIAVNKAQVEGRAQLAQQMEVKYAGVTKRFGEEVGRSNESQLLDQFTSVYKATVSQVLYGTRPKEQIVRPEGEIYRVFVLMELPTGEASRRLMEQVRANEQLYTRFRSSEAFKELDAEVQRYEQWKRDQN